MLQSKLSHLSLMVEVRAQVKNKKMGRNPARKKCFFVKIIFASLTLRLPAEKSTVLVAAGNARLQSTGNCFRQTMRGSNALSNSSTGLRMTEFKLPLFQSYCLLFYPISLNFFSTFVRCYHMGFSNKSITCYETYEQSTLNSTL